MHSTYFCNQWVINSTVLWVHKEICNRNIIIHHWAWNDHFKQSVLPKAFKNDKGKEHRCWHRVFKKTKYLQKVQSTVHFNVSFDRNLFTLTSRLLVEIGENDDVGLTPPRVTGNTIALAALHSSCTAMCTIDWKTLLHLATVDVLLEYELEK